jgi:hypothetical protein
VAGAPLSRHRDRGCAGSYGVDQISCGSRL